MASIVDESIISDFVAESRDHLNLIEPDLLAMEQGGASQDMLNRVFRAIHSIKGGAGFLAFEALKNLSHAMESVLMLVRDGKLGVDDRLMDAMFSSMDRLRAMLDDIQASDQVPIEQEMGLLRSILEHQGVEPGAQVKGQTKGEGGRKREFDLDAQDVRSALAHGMNLFHAVAHLHKDIKDKNITPLAFLNNAQSVGQVLNAYIDLGEIADLEHCLSQDLAVTILFGSVLEADLAAMALKLPAEQVAMLDMKAIRKQVKVEKAEKPGKAPAIEPQAAPLPEAVAPAPEAEAPAEAVEEGPEAASQEASAGASASGAGATASGSGAA